MRFTRLENKKIPGVLSLSRQWIIGKMFQDTKKCEVKSPKMTEESRNTPEKDYPSNVFTGLFISI